MNTLLLRHQQIIVFFQISIRSFLYKRKNNIVGVTIGMLCNMHKLCEKVFTKKGILEILDKRRLNSNLLLEVDIR